MQAVQVYTEHGVILHRGIPELRESMQSMIDEGEMPELEGDLQEFFTPELYGRRLAVLKGAVIVSRVHKTTHLVMVLRGRATIIDQDNKVSEVEAGDMWVSIPGTQRAIYCHEAFMIANVHPGDHSNFDDPLEEITFDTMDEYLAWVAASKTGDSNV